MAGSHPTTPLLSGSQADPPFSPMRRHRACEQRGEAGTAPSQAHSSASTHLSPHKHSEPGSHGLTCSWNIKLFFLRQRNSESKQHTPDRSHSRPKLTATSYLLSCGSCLPSSALPHLGGDHLWLMSWKSSHLSSDPWSWGSGQQIFPEPGTPRPLQRYLHQVLLWSGVEKGA